MNVFFHNGLAKFFEMQCFHVYKLYIIYIGCISYCNSPSCLTGECVTNNILSGGAYGHYVGNSLPCEDAFMIFLHSIQYVLQVVCP